MDFFSAYSHGFLRVALCVPQVRVADPRFNAAQTVDLARQASADGVGLALFPELGLSAYTNEDLFHQDALLEASREALGEVAEASRDLSPVIIVGVPLRFEGKLFNCAVVLYRGGILGVAPKSYLPNYREFYERRQFAPATHAREGTVELLGQQVPFGSDLIFQAREMDPFAFHVEICEDLWVPVPPSSIAAMAGAKVLCNLSASNVTIGKAAYRKTLAAGHSGRCVAAYLYSAAGSGESTTDLAWDGQALVYENGELLAESERFSEHRQLVIADIDLERLVQERMRLTSFHDCAQQHRNVVSSLRKVKFDFALPPAVSGLRREVERFPFVPRDSEQRGARCYEAYQIQVHGLVQRLRAASIKKVVIGVSGGLDSTQALIVAVRAMDRLGLPRSNVLAYTMPGFATGSRTYSNAWGLMKALGVSASEIDIRPSCLQMLKDIGHPFAAGEAVHDVTFENVQAGERTSHLFRLANLNGALVVGTGDLSELALGWNTYGVGDQMSHYNVNASVAKTFIQHLLRWIIETARFSQETRKLLQSIVDTEISPELIPGEDSEQPIQSTESVIGPYELQDFHLFFISRYGFRPSKVAFLAYQAWGDLERGYWPETMPKAEQRSYDIKVIGKWLEVFLFRFFKASQFKRSAMPNAPKVGSGGSLSPRGDWRAPSDAEAEVWLEELRVNVP
ncbi:MAG: NAD(+) synthase [Deltaproteobacteria bacterium]|nr:NAD(+) synthase [Deltaproteobacteria bacterium]